MLDVLIPMAWAQDAAAAKPSLLENLMPIIFIFGIFYFLVIMPQVRRQKKQMGFLAALKKGEQVITQGGVLGTVTGVTDRFVDLEIAPEIRIKVLKNQITTGFKEGTAS